MTKIDKLRDDLFDGNREEVEKYIRNHGDIPKNPRFFLLLVEAVLPILQQISSVVLMMSTTQTVTATRNLWKKPLRMV